MIEQTTTGSQLALKVTSGDLGVNNSGSLLNITQAGNYALAIGGNINVAAGGTIKLANTGNAFLAASGNLNITSSTINLANTGSANVDAGVVLTASGAGYTSAATSSGGNIAVSSGVLEATAGNSAASNFNVTAQTGTTTTTTGLIQVTGANSTLKASAGDKGNSTINATNSLTVDTGGQIILDNAGAATVAAVNQLNVGSSGIGQIERSNNSVSSSLFEIETTGAGSTLSINNSGSQISDASTGGGGLTVSALGTGSNLVLANGGAISTANTGSVTISSTQDIYDNGAININTGSVGTVSARRNLILGSDGGLITGVTQYGNGVININQPDAATATANITIEAVNNLSLGIAGHTSTGVISKAPASSGTTGGSGSLTVETTGTTGLLSVNNTGAKISDSSTGSGNLLVSAAAGNISSPTLLTKTGTGTGALVLEALSGNIVLSGNNLVASHQGDVYIAASGDIDVTGGSIALGNTGSAYLEAGAVLSASGSSFSSSADSSGGSVNVTAGGAINKTTGGSSSNFDVLAEYGALNATGNIQVTGSGSTIASSGDTGNALLNAGNNFIVNAATGISLANSGSATLAAGNNTALSSTGVITNSPNTGLGNLAIGSTGGVSINSGNGTLSANQSLYDNGILNFNPLTGGTVSAGVNLILGSDGGLITGVTQYGNGVININQPDAATATANITIEAVNNLSLGIAGHTSTGVISKAPASSGTTGGSGNLTVETTGTTGLLSINNSGSQISDASTGGGLTVSATGTGSNIVLTNGGAISTANTGSATINAGQDLYNNGVINLNSAGDNSVTTGRDLILGWDGSTAGTGTININNSTGADTLSVGRNLTLGVAGQTSSYGVIEQTTTGSQLALQVTSGDLGVNNSGSLLNITQAGNYALAIGGNINVAAGGTIKLANTGNAYLAASGNLNITSSTINLANTGSANVDAGVVLTASGAGYTSAATSSGGNIAVSSGVLEATAGNSAASNFNVTAQMGTTTTTTGLIQVTGANSTLKASAGDKGNSTINATNSLTVDTGGQIILDNAGAATVAAVNQLNVGSSGIGQIERSNNSVSSSLFEIETTGAGSTLSINNSGSQIGDASTAGGGLTVSALGTGSNLVLANGGAISTANTGSFTISAGQDLYNNGVINLNSAGGNSVTTGRDLILGWDGSTAGTGTININNSTGADTLSVGGNLTLGVAGQTSSYGVIEQTTTGSQLALQVTSGDLGVNNSGSLLNITQAGNYALDIGGNINAVGGTITLANSADAYVNADAILVSSGGQINLANYGNAYVAAKVDITIGDSTTFAGGTINLTNQGSAFVEAGTVLTQVNSGFSSSTSQAGSYILVQNSGSINFANSNQTILTNTIDAYLVATGNITIADGIVGFYNFGKANVEAGTTLTQQAAESPTVISSLSDTGGNIVVSNGGLINFDNSGDMVVDAVNGFGQTSGILTVSSGGQVIANPIVNQNFKSDFYLVASSNIDVDGGSINIANDGDAFIGAGTILKPEIQTIPLQNVHAFNNAPSDSGGNFEVSNGGLINLANTGDEKVYVGGSVLDPIGNVSNPPVGNLTVSNGGQLIFNNNSTANANLTVANTLSITNGYSSAIGSVSAVIDNGAGDLTIDPINIFITSPPLPTVPIPLAPDNIAGSSLLQVAGNLIIQSESSPVNLLVVNSQIHVNGVFGLQPSNFNIDPSSTGSVFYGNPIDISLANQRQLGFISIGNSLYINNSNISGAVDIISGSDYFYNVILQANAQTGNLNSIEIPIVSRPLDLPEIPTNPCAVGSSLEIKNSNGVLPAFAQMLPFSAVPDQQVQTAGGLYSEALRLTLANTGDKKTSCEKG